MKQQKAFYYRIFLQKIRRQKVCVCFFIFIKINFQLQAELYNFIQCFFYIIFQIKSISKRRLMVALLHFAIVCFLPFMVVTQSTCLNHKADDHSCLACIGTHFLQGGKCYARLRGCLVNKVRIQSSKEEIVCGECQNGYVPWGNGCQRQAVAQLRLGQLKNINNLPAPVQIQRQKLSKDNIKSQSSGPSNSVPSENKKILPSFPQIQLAKNIINQNSNKNPTRQLDGSLQKLVASKFPQIKNLHPIQMPLKVENDTQVAEKLLVYEEGSIILLIRLNLPPEPINIRKVAQSKPIVQYIPVLIGTSKKFYQQLLAIKQQILQSNFADLVSAILSLNLQLKLKSTQNRAILNIEMPNASISSLNIKKQQEEIIDKVQGLSKKKKQNQQYFRNAYSQFLGSIAILNLPDKITSVKAENVVGVPEIIFKILYQVAGQVDKEYALIKYKINRNQTQVLGYYIQGINVLSYFTTNSTNSLNQTANVNKQNNSSQAIPISNANLTGSQTKNQIEKVKQQQNNSNKTTTTNIANLTTIPTTPTTKLNEVNKTIQQNNSTAQNKSNQVNKTTVATPITDQAKINQTKPATPAVNQTKKESQSKEPVKPAEPEIKNQTMKKTNVSQTKQPQSNISQQVENIIATSQKNQTTRQLANKTEAEPKPVQKQQNCIQALNVTSVDKLDAKLRQFYGFLSKYQKSAHFYKPDDKGEKYWLVYANDEMKMQFYQAFQNKSANKLAITKSGFLNFGYSFESKQMETMNLKISDFEQNKCQKDSFYTKYLQPTLTQLLKWYKPYVASGAVMSALVNSTHIKLYISNRYITFQYVKKLDDAVSKGWLAIVDKKFGYEIWPIGTKKEILASPQVQNYKKIEAAVVKKYSMYFANGLGQMYIKNLKKQQYVAAFRSKLFGIFQIKCNITSEVVTFGNLERSVELQQPKSLPQCPTTNNHLQTSDRKCFKKITGCYKQIGNICTVCNVGLVLQPQMRQCKVSCIY